jgi:hypothetical protein
VNPVDGLQLLRHDAGLPVSPPAGCHQIGSLLRWLAGIQIGAVVPAGDNGVVVRWGDSDCSDAADPIDALRTLRHDAGLANAPVAGCPSFGDEGTVEELPQIVMDDDFFDYNGEINPDIEIGAGTEIVFAAPNVGADDDHNIHVDHTGGGFASCDGGDVCTDPELVPPGAQGSLTLQLPVGTYDFQCDIHPSDMTGRFIATD